MPLFLLIIFFTSPFWLSANAKIDDLRILYQKAESAFQSQNYAEACACFDDLAKQNLLLYTDSSTFIEVILRLSECQLFKKDFPSAEKTCRSLEPLNLPPHFFMRQKTLLAKIYMAQQRPGEAFLLLQNAKKILPFCRWKAEEKTLYMALTHTLNRHFSQMQIRAELFAESGNMQEHDKLMQEIRKAVETGYYPQAAADNKGAH